MVIVAVLLPTVLMAVADPTLYQTLGVSPMASAAEVREAYRRAALATHPDKTTSGVNGGDGWAQQTEKFIKVSEAYSVLSNRKRRAEYDASLASQQRWWQQRGSSSSSASGADSQFDQGYRFSFSLEQALEVLEKLMEASPTLRPIVPSYRAAKAQLASWPGFRMPLPELLASGALLTATAKLIDWEAVGSLAKNALLQPFERDDGSINWGKMAAVGAAGAAAVAAALDASDDGNRTETMLTFGRKAMSFAQSLMSGRSPPGASPPPSSGKAPRKAPADEL